MKHIQLFEQFGKEDSVIESTTDKKIPQSIQKLIGELTTSGIGITQAHINKEFEQEGKIKLDSGGVNPEALGQIKKLIEGCKKANPTVKFPKDLISGYRSYKDQVINFRNKVKGGRSVEDVQTSNTLPGFSQHHTGKAFDVFSTEDKWWASNKAVKDWVTNNCGKYGFEVTYKVQGPVRQAEPWHLNFKGGQTL